MPDPTPPGRCPPSPDPARRVQERREPYLRDTLAVLPAVEDGPGNAAGVLALEEQRLGLAVLEPEDLAVATDVQLTLRCKTRSELSSSQPKQVPPPVPSTNFPPRSSSGVVWLRGAVTAALLDSGVGNSASVAIAGMGHPYLAGVDPLAGERIVVRSHFGGGCRVVVVGVASSESKVQGPRFQVDFRQILWCRLWDRAAL